MLRLLLFTISFALLGFDSSVQAANALEAPLPPEHIGFPNNSLPAGINASKSRITPDSSRSVWSSHSLRWDWLPGAAVEFKHPIPWRDLKKRPLKSKLGSPATNCFVVWIYNEKPLPNSPLRFSFSNKNTEVCHFDFNLDFRGWRTAWVSYDRDMQGSPTGPMDGFSITAPKTASPHTLWIGDILPHVFIDHRHQNGDYQVPFVNGADKRTTGHFEPVMYWYDLRKTINQNTPVLPEHRRAFTTLRQRLTPKPGKLPNEKKLSALICRADALKIRKINGQIYGEHIYFLHALAGAPLPKDRQIKGHDFAEVLDLLLDLARAHHAFPPEQKNSPAARQIAERFCLITEHLLDRGFCAGSSRGTLHHFGYSARSWAPAVFLMQEPLHEAGLLEPSAEALRWFFNAYHILTPPPVHANMDYLNTLAPSELLIHLIGPDNGAKVERLARYSAWLSGALAADSPGDGGGIKPDGSLYHHKMHYHGYGIPALENTIAKVAAPLDGTPFEITPAAYDSLKNATLAATWWGYPYSGLNACGRHPLTARSPGLPNLLTTLAKARPGTNRPDSQLAVSRLANTTGHRAFNHHSGAIHKWGERSVQLKGYGEGIRWGETYKKDNRYGRYQSHGTHLIFTNTTEHPSGYRQDGWDWSKPPGATTLLLPPELLEGSTAFHGRRPKQKSRPSGAASLDDRYGAFLFQLDPTKDPQSLRVRKSIFSIDGLLVCLGSNLSSAHSDHPLATTLFQSHLQDQSVAPQHLPELKALLDPQGNGYYLADGQAARFSTSLQHSLHNKTRKPTQGEFATAWIDHGTAPKNASYHYHVLLDSSPKALADWHKKMNSAETPVQVLRQDKTAHIIRIPANDLTAAAYFAPYQAESPDELIRSTTRSCLAITRTLPDGSLRLALTDPDHPDIGKSLNPPALQITLAGVWKLPADTPIKATYQNQTTTLTIPHNRAVPQQLTLHRDTN